jgi:hypothetical protein
MGIRIRSAASLGVSLRLREKSGSQICYIIQWAETGQINGRLHETILSDGILPQQIKKDKILYDKIPFV